MKKLIIIGAGSVGKFIAYNMAEFAGEYTIEGFLDDDSQKQNQIIAGFKVLGNLETLKEYSGKGYAVAFGIAFPKIKKQILNQYSDLDLEFPNFIAKSSWLSKAVTLGKGCIIYPGVAINYESMLGDFVVINMNCSIGHNCTIANYTSLAPGANLGGHTVLNEGVDFGIGASTKQSIIVGSHAIIGGQAMLVFECRKRCPDCRSAGKKQSHFVNKPTLIKRIFDIFFSLLGLIGLSWLILISYIIATIDTGANGIFTQQRIGQFGKPFTIFKLKTMHQQTGNVSAIGFFFRKYKIDELPQLFNVLFGTMTFVGPRPDIAGYYDTLEGENRKILELKPGITGTASLKYFNEEEILQLQENPIHYNDTVIFPDKVKMNLDYYYNHSFLGDIKIIWRTFFR